MEERLNSTKTLDDLWVRKRASAPKRRDYHPRWEHLALRKRSPRSQSCRKKRRARAFANTNRGKRNGAVSRGKHQRDLQKYSVTVTAIFLAAGITVGVVVGALTNDLKCTGKALGKGLKALGQNTASMDSCNAARPDRLDCELPFQNRWTSMFWFTRWLMLRTFCRYALTQPYAIILTRLTTDEIGIELTCLNWSHNPHSNSRGG